MSPKGLPVDGVQCNIPLSWQAVDEQFMPLQVDEPASMQVSPASSKLSNGGLSNRWSRFAWVYNKEIGVQQEPQ